MKAWLNLAMLALGLLHPQIAWAQQTPSRPTSLADTTLAQNYFDRGKELTTRAKNDSAIYYLEKAREIYKKLLARREEKKFWEKLIPCDTGVGRNLIAQAKYDSARTRLNQALAMGLEKLGPNHPEMGHCYNLLGVIASDFNKYDQAISFYNQALAIWLPALGENHSDVAACYNNLGLVYYSKASYKQALEIFNTALNIRRQTQGENHFGVAQLYNNIGLVYESLGDYHQELGHYTRALSILRQTVGESHPAVGTSYNNIGNVYRRKGDYERALEYYQKAWRIQRQNFGENHPRVATCYFNLGVVHHNEGDYDQALAYYNKAAAIHHQAYGESNYSLGVDYSNIGDIYSLKGDHDQAISYNIKALAILRQSLGEKHDFLAQGYINLGDAYNRKGEYDQVIANLNQALKINLSLLGEYHVNTMLLHAQLGKAHAGKGDYQQARVDLAKAVHIGLQIFGARNSKVGGVYFKLAEVHRQQRDWAKALAHYQKAIVSLATDFQDTSIYSNPSLNNASSDEHLLFALSAKAESLRRLYLVSSHDRRDLLTALSTSRLAIDLIEQKRFSYKAEGSKLFLAETAARIYDNAIQTALQLYELTREPQYQQQAFQFAERGKSAVLAAALQETRARQFAGIPDSLLEKEKNLRLDLALYETQIQKEHEKKDGRDSLKIADFESRYFSLKTHYAQLVEALEQNYPKYYELKYQTRSTEIAALQKSLAPGSALLEYFVGDSAIHIFTISQKDFGVKSVAKDTTFDRLVASFLRSIKKIENAAFVKSSRAIYKILLAPIQDQIVAAKKLIIIPDGALSYVPFEALIAGNVPKAGQAEIDFTKLDYLIRRYEISYHYSATLFQKAVSDQAGVASRRRDESFLGFAPVFSDSIRNGYILASTGETAAFPVLAENLRSVMIDGKRFSELKFAEKEVAGIIQLFEQKKKTSRAYFHREASEENFKGTAGSYKYLHLATHGILNEKNPKLSGLIFSQPSDSGHAEDGVLYAGETFNLATNADLVVLSSCESGLGKLVKGEGLMAITRGFIYAGASNIIVSLWKVYDKHTSELMVELYKNILAGKNYVTALREAKLQMIRGPATAFPQKWSAFVLVGK